MLYFRKGFTLIELIMVISITTIIAVSGIWLLPYFIENASILSDDFTINDVLSDIFNTICEGDSQAGGIKFAAQITESGDTSLRFLDQDNQDVRILLNEQNKITRSIDGGEEKLVPYYMPSSINLTAPEGKLFQYYDEFDILTTVPGSVRRVEISIVANSSVMTKEMMTGARMRR